MATLPKKMLPLRLQVFKQFLLRTNLLTPARKAAAVSAGVQLPTASAFTGPPVQLAPPSRESHETGCCWQAVGGWICGAAHAVCCHRAACSAGVLDCKFGNCLCWVQSLVSCPQHLSSKGLPVQLTPCSCESFSSICELFWCWH